MNHKLTTKDYWFILVCLIICVISFYIGTEYFYNAFPEASIDFKITREQSKPIAEEFLKKQGVDLSEYRHTAVFTHDDRAKVFLEREIGLEEANKIMGTEVKLWRWSNRWFKPLQKEEFRINVSPRGEIISFRHLIPEERDGANLPPEEARQIAKDYVANSMGREITGLEFIEVETEKRPNRTDHTFTWKETDFDIKDSTYRMSVVIQGDQVGGYREYLKVPEQWIRGYEKLRSLNNTTDQVASFFLLLTLVAILVVFVSRTRRKDIKWKTASFFGIVAFVLAFLASLNSFPLMEFGYDTTESYASFITTRLLQSLLGALFSGGAIFMLTASAEPLYREHYKKKISLTNSFIWRGMRTKKFLISIILGMTLTFFFFAYQTIFYLAADKLGAWAPTSIPYTNMLSTKFPWIFVLLVGFFPAVSEEFISRMFSIPFLKKYLKFTWLAVIIPAMIWGFAHASYPAQPFYIRGIEVGLGGIIIGIIMLRFGILACLVWHYTVDALYTAFLLFRSDNVYFVTTAAITAGIMLIPLVISLVMYIKTKTFQDDEELLNEVEGTSILPKSEKEAPEEFATISYQPLTNKRIFAGIIAVGILLSFYFIKVDKFGEFVDFAISKGDAKLAADNYLEYRNVNPNDYQSVEFQRSGFDKLAGKYILEREGIEKLNEVFGENTKSALWTVRYFKPLEKEEYKIDIDVEEGNVYSFDHLIAEEAEGDTLDSNTAYQLATDFLKSKGLRLEDYELKESKSERRKARMDHKFILEAKGGNSKNVEESKFRLRVIVQGNKVDQFSKYMKVPENWERERRERTITNAVLLGLRVTFIVLFFLVALWALVTNIRSGSMRWKKVLIISLGLIGIGLLDRINNLPLLYVYYSSSIAPNVFLTRSLFGILAGLVGIFLSLAVTLGIITSLYPEALTCFRKENRCKFARDAIIGTLLFVGGSFAIDQMTNMLTAKFPEVAIMPGLSAPDYLDTPLPFISNLSDVLQSSIFEVAMIGLLIYIVLHKIRRIGYVVPLFILVLISFVSGEAKTIGEFLFSFISLLLPVVFIAFMVIFFFRNNLVAYVLGIFVLSGTQSANALFSQSYDSYKINGVILFGITVLPILWLLFEYLRNRRGNLE